MNFRDKAADIKARGVAERDNFTPRGTPKKMWQYWASHTRNKPERENFCHYWRVVAIWAPLMFFRRGLERWADSVWMPITLVALYVTLMTLFFTYWGLAGAGFAMLGVPYFMLGVLMGAVVLDTDEYVDDREKLAVRIGFWATLPISGPIWAVGKIVMKYPKQTQKALFALGIGFAAIAILFALGIMLYEAYTAIGWWIAVWVALGLATGVGFVFGISVVSDWISGLRSKWEEERYEREYEERMNYDPDAVPVPEPREPSKASLFFKAVGRRINSFFRSIGDFIIFIAQVVRVKKWGICPIMDMETTE